MSDIYDRATALTWARGCEQWNPCWFECWKAARDRIKDGELDEWETRMATIDQYRIYTGQSAADVPVGAVLDGDTP